MPLNVTCRTCGQVYKVAANLYGQRVACTKCHGAIDIPNPQVVERPPGNVNHLSETLPQSRPLTSYPPARTGWEKRKLVGICAITAGAVVGILVLLMIASSIAGVAVEVLLGLNSAGHTTHQVLPPKESFDVEMPAGPNWQKLIDGPVDGNDTYSIAVADTERGIQLTILVLPTLAKAPTLDEMKSGWERGFLEKASRKKSSANIQIGRHDAYQLIAEVDTEEGPYELIGILVMAEGHNFTLGITKRGGNALSHPDVDAFIKSFSVRTFGRQ